MRRGRRATGIPAVAVRKRTQREAESVGAKGVNRGNIGGVLKKRKCVGGIVGSNVGEPEKGEGGDFWTWEAKLLAELKRVKAITVWAAPEKGKFGCSVRTGANKSLPSMIKK